MLSALIAFWILCAAGTVLVCADFGLVYALIGILLGILGPFGLGAALYYERQQTRQQLEDEELAAAQAREKAAKSISERE